MSRPEAQSLSPYTTSANRAKLLAKNRQTFLLQTTKLTRIARRMCRDILQPRRAARRPYAPINANAIKAECTCAGLGGRTSWAPPSHTCSLLPSIGSIRLPKAAKTPLKIHPLVRLPLATIVKELGKGLGHRALGTAGRAQLGRTEACSPIPAWLPMPHTSPFPLGMGVTPQTPLTGQRCSPLEQGCCSTVFECLSEDPTLGASVCPWHKGQSGCNRPSVPLAAPGSEMEPGCGCLLRLACFLVVGRSR